MFNSLEEALRSVLKSVLVEVLERDFRPRTVEPPQLQKNEVALMRPREAAESLAISAASLCRLTRAGAIPCVRIGRLVRYDPYAIRLWLGQSSAPRSRAAEVAIASSRGMSIDCQGTSLGGPQKKELPTKAQDHRALPERKRLSQASQKHRADREPRRVYPYFAERLGIDLDHLPTMTNGELMRIANIDMPTFHAWVYHNGELPDVAMANLDAYFMSQKR